MDTFNKYLARVDEGLFDFLGLGSGLPKDMTPEEREEYQNLKKGGVGHKEALKLALRHRRQNRPAPNQAQTDYEAGWR